MNEIEILIPITGILVGGGLIALFLLKPFGSRILDILEETNRSRRDALHDDRKLRRLHDRLDLLAERQDFVEALLEEGVERRLEGGHRAERAAGGAGTGPSSGAEPAGS